jgi:carboxylesterase type B
LRCFALFPGDGGTARCPSDPKDDQAPEDEKIAQAMLSYLMVFAKTGDPSSGNTPAWPRYLPATDMAMELTENGPVAEEDPIKAILDVTAAYVTSAAPPPPPRLPVRP